MAGSLFGPETKLRQEPNSRHALSFDVRGIQPAADDVARLLSSISAAAPKMPAAAKSAIASVQKLAADEAGKAYLAASAAADGKRTQAVDEAGKAYLAASAAADGESRPDTASKNKKKAKKKLKKAAKKAADLGAERAEALSFGARRLPETRDGYPEKPDIQQLRNAVLWAEILGEPVSRKRRRRRLSMESLMQDQSGR